MLSPPGHGMFIQTSIGHSLINMTTVDNNWGDGIKFYMTNLTIHDFTQKFLPGVNFYIDLYFFYRNLIFKQFVMPNLQKSKNKLFLVQFLFYCISALYMNFCDCCFSVYWTAPLSYVELLKPESYYF